MAVWRIMGADNTLSRAEIEAAAWGGTAPATPKYRCGDLFRVRVDFAGLEERIRFYEDNFHAYLKELRR